ncbi:hypothetical protein C8T65DRAFT_643991 [Cerioporus squamosus]|nr:hypothetical protein C8T65DRAFT_643807 [Cerioporus squamosus]KAI0715513.1 hypothetical protein C8T65DRAFT_643991 [Cerioporus squamosus]
MSPGPGDDLDLPPSDPAMSESESSRVSADIDSNFSSQHAVSSSYSVVSQSQLAGVEHGQLGKSGVQDLATMYRTFYRNGHSHAGRSPAVTADWHRENSDHPGERAAEMLFEGGDVDESSVEEVILDMLLKAELTRAVSQTSNSTSSSAAPSRAGKPRPAVYNRHAALRPLLPYFAILSNPAPPPPASASAAANAGKAPAFTAAMMAWVGGSLAGYVTGGVEVQREEGDEAEAQPDEDVPMDSSPPQPGAGVRSSPAKNILSDWTRTPLPVGAPPAPRPPGAAAASPSVQVAG